MADAHWIYRNGAFYVKRSASIARDFKLPDMARIDMDLRWEGALNLAIALYADTLNPVSLVEKEKEPAFGGFYSLQLRYYTGLMAIRQQEPIRSLEPVLLSELINTNQARFSVYVNKRKSSIALAVNGVLAREWIDTNGFAGAGTCLRLVHQDESALKLGYLRVAPWNGVLRPRNDGPMPTNLDAVVLRNGRVLSGRVASVSSTNVALMSAGTELQVALADAREIVFCASRGASDRWAGGNTRVFFGRSGRLTFDLGGVDGDVLTGTNGVFGLVRINLKTCESIRFKPGD
jgi:hypothetical protein